VNQRLKQLKEQAEFVGDRYALPDEFAEKFAELIVRECAYVGDKYRSGTDVGNIIKQHFGVKE
jgi:hypothetical protein